MKNLKCFIFALLAISLTACSKSALNLESKKINGPLGKFYEVVEKDYQVNGKEISVEFKRIAEGGPKDASWSTRPTFTAELFDKSGNLISSESTDVVFTEEQLETVFALGVGETASITFKFNGKIKGAVKMKLSSKWDEQEETEESNNAYVSESDEENTGSSDWDDDDDDDDDDDWEDVEKAAKASKSAYKAAKAAYKAAKEIEDDDWDW